MNIQNNPHFHLIINNGSFDFFYTPRGAKKGLRGKKQEEMKLHDKKPTPNPSREGNFKEKPTKNFR
jgi:hypothetical protein